MTTLFFRRHRTRVRNWINTCSEKNKLSVTFYDDVITFITKQKKKKDVSLTHHEPWVLYVIESNFHPRQTSRAADAPTSRYFTFQIERYERCVASFRERIPGVNGRCKKNFFHSFFFSNLSTILCERNTKVRANLIKNGVRWHRLVQKPLEKSYEMVVPESVRWPYLRKTSGWETWIMDFGIEDALISDRSALEKKSETFFFFFFSSSSTNEMIRLQIQGEREKLIISTCNYIETVKTQRRSALMRKNSVAWADRYRKLKIQRWWFYGIPRSSGLWRMLIVPGIVRTISLQNCRVTILTKFGHDLNTLGPMRKPLVPFFFFFVNGILVETYLFEKD